jgi:hypothetical protein
VDGGVSIAEMGQRIFDMILAAASGEPTKSERHGYGQNEFVPWQVGAVMCICTELPGRPFVTPDSYLSSRIAICHPGLDPGSMFTTAPTKPKMDPGSSPG